MSRLQQTRRLAAERAVSARRLATRLPRPLERIDGGLVATVAALVVVGGIAAYALASWIEANGYLAPPVVVEIEDPRILSDYRDNPAGIIGLVSVGNDLLIGRRDGTIDRFDMALRTFAAEALPRDGQLLGDLSLIAADCGTGDCAEDGTAYAVTSAGGLARRASGGRWSVVLGDVAFVGTDGTAVEQADVRGWAVSGDGSWVLVDAGVHGLGLFDQRDGSWQRLPGLPDARLGPLHHAGAFWMAGAQGIYRITPGPGQSLAVLPGTEGEILDLAESGGNRLLAIRRGVCAAGGAAGCLSILSLDALGRVSVLQAESESHPDLNDTGLAHIALQADGLVTIGTAGVHRYDIGARRWERLADQQPTAHFATTGGARLHVALPDEVLTLAGSRVVSRVAIDQPLVQLLPGDGSVLYGLDRAGRILSLDRDRLEVLAEADPGFPADVRFSHAFGWGGRFVALGAAGVLVHDASTRRYGFVLAAALPELPLQDTLVVAGAPGDVWFLGRSSGAVSLMTISGDVASPQIALTVQSALGAPVVQARPVAGGIEAIAADGRVRFVPAISDAPVQTRTGAPLGSRLTPVAMAVSGASPHDTLYMTDGTRILTYAAARRGWQPPVAAPQISGPLTDIAVAGGGRLLTLDAGGTALYRDGTTWLPLSGTVGAGFAAAEVEDALVWNSRLFLASGGRVQSYDPVLRGFQNSWQTAGRHAEILSVHQGEPIWTTDAGLFRGEEPLVAGAHFEDAWLSADGPVAMVQHDGRRSLILNGHCLYAGVAPPRGTLLDVVPLNNTQLLVRTVEGAGLFEPGWHRWLRVDGLGGDADSRFMVLNGHLLRLDQAGLASVPLSRIGSRDSCDRRNVTIEWVVVASGLQASLVDGAPEVLLLADDGSLRRWRSGSLVIEAPAPGLAPQPSTLLRAYPRPDGIAFLGASSLWTYRLPDRTWHRQAFAGAPANVAQIDAVWQGDTPVVSLWDSAGALWIGGVTAQTTGRQPAPAAAISAASAGPGITFVRASLPVLPEVSIPPTEILQFATIGGRHIVLSPRAAQVFRPAEAVPYLELTLPQAVQGWSLAQDDSGVLIFADGPLTGPETMYRVDPATRGRHALTAVAAQHSPGDDRAHRVVQRAGTAPSLLRIDRQMNTLHCRLDPGENARCERVTPPPMPLTRHEVRAWDQRSRTLVTPDSLWSMDEALRPVARIEGPQVHAEGRLFLSGPVLMYWEGPGRRLWQLREGRADVVGETVDALVPLPRADTSTIAAVIGGTVAGLVDGALVQVSAPEALGGNAPVLAHFTTRGHVFLTAEGQALTVHGEMSDPLIAFGDAVAAVLPLPASLSPGVTAWLRAGQDGTLAILRRGTCEVPPPPAPVLPDDFVGPPEAPVVVPPQVEPCMTRQDLPLGLGSGELLVSLDDDPAGEVLVIATTERRVMLHLEGLRIQGEERLSGPRVPEGFSRGLPADSFREVDGRSYLNPPELVGRELLGGPSREQLTILEPGVPSPFDLGWLTWQPRERAFSLATADGRVRVSAGDMIRDRRFVPLHEGRGAALADGRVAWLNPWGLWHQDGTAFVRRAGPGVLRPQALDAGRFLDAAQGQSAADGAVTPGTHRRFDVEALQLEVDALAGRVTSSYQASGSRLPGFAGRGFQHDRRISVAQERGQVRWLTPLGLVDRARLSPAQDAPQGASRLAVERGRLLFGTPQGWMASGGSGGDWVPAAQPYLDQDLAAENGRVWERRDGRVTVRPSAAAETWRVAGQGLDFDIGRLLAFAATPHAAVALTAAGTRGVERPGQLQGAAAPPGPPPVGRDVDARRVGPGVSVLYARGPQGYEVWDQAARRWRAPGPDEQPWERRGPVQAGDLRVRFDPVPQFTIDAVPIRGGTGQAPVAVPFAWRAGDLMPFDHFTALHADPGQGTVLLGTRLGLRSLVARGSGFDGLGLYVPSGAAPAVTAIGRPVSTPGRIEVAFSDGYCAEAPQPEAVPTTCTAVAGLSARHVTDNALWQWTEGTGGVRGAYRLSPSGTLDLPRTLQGAMPHDLLADRMTCNGRQVEQWRGYEVLSIADARILVPGLRTIHCLAEPMVLDGGVRLDAGLFVLTSAGAFRESGGQFTRLSEDQAAALVERLDGRAVLDVGRLRYGLYGGQPTTRLLNLAGRWTPVPWEQGRLTLDQPRALAWRNGLQTVTNAGVVDARRGRLEPGSVVAMEGAVAGAVAACAPTAAETLDGRRHGVSAVSGGDLRLQCADGTRLQGPADGRRDLGAFDAGPGIPEERVLIGSDGLWHATQSRTADGRSAGIALRFRDEPARLSAGRFDFDDWQAVAAPFDGQIELITASGWWRAPVATLNLAGTIRHGSLPVDARQVRGASLDRSRRDDEPGLCLDLPAGGSRFWNGHDGLEAGGACRAYRGRDPLWTWWSTDEGPRADSISLNGLLVQRSIAAGRFTDLVVTGAPMAGDGGQLFVPARLGVLRLALDRRAVTGLYAGNDADSGGYTGVLVPDITGAPVVVSGDGANSLQGEPRAVPPGALACPALHGLPGVLGGRGRILSVAASGTGHVSVVLGFADLQRQVLIDCADITSSLSWSSIHLTADHPRSLALGEHAIAELGVSLDAGQIALADGRREARAPGIADGTVRALLRHPGGDEVFIADMRALYSVSVTSALGYLATQGRMRADSPSEPGPEADPASPPAIAMPAEAEPVPELSSISGRQAADTPPAPALTGKPASTLPLAPAPSPSERTETAGTSGTDRPPAVRVVPAPESTASSGPGGSVQAAPPSARTQADEPRLDVRAVQQALLSVPPETIVVDGIIGPQTRRVIGRWQTGIGAEPTGYLSAGQLRLLLEGGP